LHFGKSSVQRAAPFRVALVNAGGLRICRPIQKNIFQINEEEFQHEEVCSCSVQFALGSGDGIGFFRCG
jgi:hypothetical protein